MTKQDILDLGMYRQLTGYTIDRCPHCLLLKNKQCICGECGMDPDEPVEYKK